MKSVLKMASETFGISASYCPNKDPTCAAIQRDIEDCDAASAPPVLAHSSRAEPTSVGAVLPEKRNERQSGLELDSEIVIPDIAVPRPSGYSPVGLKECDSQFWKQLHAKFSTAV